VHSTEEGPSAQIPQVPPVADSPDADGGPGRTRSDRHEPRDLARKMAGGIQASVGLATFATAVVVAVATVIGTSIGQLVSRNNAVFLAILALSVLYALSVLCLYFWGTIRRPLDALRRVVRRHGIAAASAERVAQPEGAQSEGGTARWHTAAWRSLRGAAAVCILAAWGFAPGYLIIGYGLARGPVEGAAGLLVTLALIAAVVTGIRWWRRSWPAWFLFRARTVVAFCVAAASLSAGATLGGAVLAPPCAVAAELRVLTSAEDLSAVQAAIPGFENYEPARQGTSCYVVHLTAYAAPSDSAASSGLSSGWDSADLASDGPRPDIWIPSSSAEISQVRERAPRRLTPLGSVGSSPLVVAVPDALISNTSLARMSRHVSWVSLYAGLGQARVGLAMPSPVLSEAAGLEIAALYPGLDLAEERAIEASGSFPSDGGSLLCGAAQTAQEGTAAAQSQRTAYLVSEAALIRSNAGFLTDEGCAALPNQSPPRMTAFYPSGTTALDFPFTIVNWGGSPAAARRRAGYARDFYHWLVTSTEARKKLLLQGLDQPRCPRQRRLGSGGGSSMLPCQATSPPASTAGAAVSSALIDFRKAQAPSRILIGIDASGSMSQYLTQITAAVGAELGPGGADLGRADSIGIWELAGLTGRTYQTLVPLGPAGTSSVLGHRVRADMGVLTGNGHSHNYDVLMTAAGSLYAKPSGRPMPVNSVVLLTDGDIYPRADPGGNSSVTVTTRFRTPTPDHTGIRLFILVFGPVGCTESAAPSAHQTLEALALATGGTCQWVDGSDPRQALAQVFSRISTGN
jgi:Bacterial extracellular solute-binding protein